MNLFTKQELEQKTISELNDLIIGFKESISDLKEQKINEVLELQKELFEANGLN